MGNGKYVNKVYGIGIGNGDWGMWCGFVWFAVVWWVGLSGAAWFGAV